MNQTAASSNCRRDIAQKLRGHKIERDETDNRLLDQKKSVPLDARLLAASLGNVEREVLSTIVVPSVQHQTLLARASSSEFGK